MSNRTREIADHIVTELQAAPLSQPSAKRVYLARHSLKDMDDTVVRVVPIGKTLGIASRDFAADETHIVHIGVFRRLDSTAKSDDGITEADVIVDLIETIEDHFRQAGPLPGDDSVIFAGAQNFLFDDDLLAENDVIGAVTQLSYRRIVE